MRGSGQGDGRAVHPDIGCRGRALPTNDGRIEIGSAQSPSLHPSGVETNDALLHRHACGAFATWDTTWSRLTFGSAPSNSAPWRDPRASNLA